jgi:hypothetical protein
MLKERRLTLADILMLAGTRGMLGVGIGLLVSDRLSADQRLAVGRTLLVVGLVTTVPLLMRVFRDQPPGAALPA